MAPNLPKNAAIRSSWMRRTCSPNAARSSRTFSVHGTMCQPTSPHARRPCLVALDPCVAAVPPRVPGLDAEPGVGPGEVEVDHLAGAQGERELTLRVGEPRPEDGLEDVELEAALARAGSQRRLLQPVLEPLDAGPALPADLGEVHRRVVRCDELEMPAVLRRPLEPVLVEHGRQPEQHPHRRGESQAAAVGRVSLEVDPRGTMEATPGRHDVALHLRHGHLDDASGHLAESVEGAGAEPADERVGAGVQLQGHRPRGERLLAARQPDDAGDDGREHVVLPGSVEACVRRRRGRRSCSIDATPCWDMNRLRTSELMITPPMGVATGRNGKIRPAGRTGGRRRRRGRGR